MAPRLPPDSLGKQDDPVGVDLVIAANLNYKVVNAFLPVNWGKVII